MPGNTVPVNVRWRRRKLLEKLAKTQLKSCLKIQFQCVFIVLTFIVIGLPYRVEMRCMGAARRLYHLDTRVRINLKKTGKSLRAKPFIPGKGFKGTARGAKPLLASMGLGLGR